MHFKGWKSQRRMRGRVSQFFFIKFFFFNLQHLSRFGVCCVFIIKDDDKRDVKYNETYIQNPGFPSAYGKIDALSYTVRKMNDGESIPC